jgi:hypothetical protein
MLKTKHRIMDSVRRTQPRIRKPPPPHASVDEATGMLTTTEADGLGRGPVSPDWLHLYCLSHLPASYCALLLMLTSSLQA